jgi:pyruvate ferredoxin oxidoreductase gamma subunit
MQGLKAEQGVLAMLQIRIHGRGGQGVVTAAEMLSIAAFGQGRHAQAFPSFGSERTGAPVVAFCRIADQTIRLREPILAPDVLIVQDPTLLHQVDVFQGLQPDGYVLINSKRGFDELGLSDIAQHFRHERLTTVPATEIAIKHLGRPLPNAVLLGGFAALSGLVSLEAVAHAIREKFSGKLADGNIAAATEAFEFVKSEMEELARAQTD